MDKSHDIGNISKTNIAIQTESTPVKKPIETYAADKDVNLFLQKPADEIHDTHRNETTEILNKNLPSTQTEESSQPNEVDSSISINKSVQTIVDIIFFPFYPIRVKVISLELTIKYSTFIVNTLKIVTISLSASIIAIAAILSVPELFAGAPLVLILAYIFWPTRPMNSNDNITIQDENSNLVMNENNSNIVNNEPTSTANNEEDLQEDIITPQKHKKQLFEREVEKCLYKNEKLAGGGSIMRRGVIIPKDRIGAFVGHYPIMLTHPDEDRFINYREAMSIMGLPEDFELVDANPKVANHICQNVPVQTATDMASEVLAVLKGERIMVDTDYIVQYNGTKKMEYETKVDTLEAFFG